MIIDQYKKMKNLFLRQSYIDAWEDYQRSIRKRSFAQWDYIVLTASNEEQANAFQSQITYRQNKNVLPCKTKYLVLPDPDGKRVGSGGATLQVLQKLAEQEDIAGDFHNKRILVIHSGGDSKRVPQYSVCGKLFSPVPRELLDGRASTLFDEFLIGMAGVPSRFREGMLVLSGDVLLLFNPLQIDAQFHGAAAISMKSPVDVGKDHGVFLNNGKDYVKICRHKGLCDEADTAQKAIEQMEKTVMDAGWDGEWYLRAYDHYKHKIGSKECEDGKIFIEPQGFCVIAEIGKDEGLCLKAMQSVEKYLDTKYGIVLLQPPYHRYHVELGEISSYPPGYKENAGIFCHNNPWISIAETVIGRGNRAWQVYTRTCPAYIEDISEIHRTEPYVYSQMIAGKDAPNFGEAKNSWLTGTAAWTFLDVSQYILGIRPDYDGLIIDPCIPDTMDGFTAKRKFRGNTYHITVRNPAHVQKGVTKLIVDGATIDGNMIPAINGTGHDVTVEVTMG